MKKEMKEMKMEMKKEMKKEMEMDMGDKRWVGRKERERRVKDANLWQGACLIRDK